MKKMEAKHQTVFNQYLREKKIYGYFELKATTANSFPFSKIEIHQYIGLLALEYDGLVWKFSDEDQRQKPCDGLNSPPLPAYLVIHFTDTFYMIRIKEIVRLKKEGLIAISREMAGRVAEKIIRLK